jgi:hypothetical protein
MEFIDILNNSRKEYVMGLSEIQEVIMFLDRNMDGEVKGTKYTGLGLWRLRSVCIYLSFLFRSIFSCTKVHCGGCYFNQTYNNCADVLFICETVLLTHRVPASRESILLMKIISF